MCSDLPRAKMDACANQKPRMQWGRNKTCRLMQQTIRPRRQVSSRNLYQKGFLKTKGNSFNPFNLSCSNLNSSSSLKIYFFAGLYYIGILDRVYFRLRSFRGPSSENHLSLTGGLLLKYSFNYQEFSLRSECYCQQPDCLHTVSLQNAH